MTAATGLAKAVSETAFALFPKHEWINARRQFNKIGINTEYYDMRCATFEATYDAKPELFNCLQWVNDENGMPLWVRPGVNWIPDYELNENHLAFDLNDYY